MSASSCAAEFFGVIPIPARSHVCAPPVVACFHHVILVHTCGCAISAQWRCVCTWHIGESDPWRMMMSDRMCHAGSSAGENAPSAISSCVSRQVNEKPYRPDVCVFLNPAHYLGYSLGLGYCIV